VFIEQPLRSFWAVCLYEGPDRLLRSRTCLWHSDARRVAMAHAQAGVPVTIHLPQRGALKT
jgi:hypothetical protein